MMTLSVTISSALLDGLADQARKSRQSLDECARDLIADALVQKRGPMPLTVKQAELYQYLSQRQAAGLVSPSFSDMQTALGLKSKSGVHRLLQSMEERGAIRRLAYRARAIELVGRAG